MNGQQGTPAPAQPTPGAAASGTPAPATPAPAQPAPATPQQPDPTPQQMAPMHPSGQQANVDAAMQAAQGDQWYNALPEAHHETLKQFGSIDDALSAIKAGQQFVQATKVEDYNFTFADQNIDQNAGPILDFKNFCLEKKIPPSQAQELLEYQTDLMAKAHETQRQMGEAELRKEWGNSYDANITKAVTALAAIDRATGAGLAEELKRTGDANRPATIRALLWVAEKIGEDSLGGGGAASAHDNQPISTEQAYANLFGQR